MIIIIDYGMGNIGSLINMLKKVGSKALPSGDPEVIKQASKIILPGVGAFDGGMQHLTARGLTEVLNQKALEEKIPVLGVCLGMQLLAKRSEEGTLPGLGWIDADVVRFNFADLPEKPRIPHMGWNEVNPRHDHSLFKDLMSEARFYFVHSYHLKCKNEEDVLAQSDYGYSFCSSVQRGNIMGTQFHPEKSHRFGMTLLKNFVAL